MISLDLPEGTITPVPGGVTDHHVTVVYLGPDVDDDAYAVACQRAASAAAAMPGPLAAEVGGIGSFPPSGSSDGKVPAWAAVLIPGAERLREALADLSASEHTDWKPHVTLAYVDPGDPLPARVPQTPVTFTHLSVHRGDDVARFPLGAPPAPDCCGAECCQDGGCCGGESGCECGPKAPDGSAVTKAAKGPTLHLPTLTGIWGDIYARREKLLTKHARAVAAAWDACIAELGSPAQRRAVVPRRRGEASPSSPTRTPSAGRTWAPLPRSHGSTRLARTKGYPALVAAIEDAIRSGMAEGEADALALAADRQGVAGFKIDRAFRAAYERLADDGEISRKAADAAESMIDGAATDTGRALADQAEHDGTEQDMTAAAGEAAAGTGRGVQVGRLGTMGCHPGRRYGAVLADRFRPARTGDTPETRRHHP